MGTMKALIQRIKIMQQVKRNLRKSGVSRKQLKKQLQDHANRPLDIAEILSRDCSDKVVVDAYEYCMRKCDWEPSNVEELPVRDFLLCVLFNGEVANGGIAQFLSNDTGDMWEETLGALKRINRKQADLFSQAIKYFPEGDVPKDRALRNDFMDHFSEDAAEYFDELDQLVYKCETQDYYDYLMAHKSNFLNYK